MAFKRISTADQNLQFIQDNVSQALANPSTTQLSQSVDSQGRQTVKNSTVPAPFSSGNVVSWALKAGGDNLLPHGLQRVPNFWLIVRTDANSTVWEAQTTTLADKAHPTQSATATYLNLHCSANCNALVWVA